MEARTEKSNLYQYIHRYVSDDTYLLNKYFIEVLECVEFENQIHISDETGYITIYPGRVETNYPDCTINEILSTILEIAIINKNLNGGKK